MAIQFSNWIDVLTLCQATDSSEVITEHRGVIKKVNVNLMSNTGSACPITRARGSWYNNPDRIGKIRSINIRVL